MSSHIYLMGIDGRPQVKIGRSTHPEYRREALQTGSPEQISILWQRPGGAALENWLHQRFIDYRIRGEWFDLTSLGDAVEVVSGAACEWAGLQKTPSLKPSRPRGMPRERRRGAPPAAGKSPDIRSYVSVALAPGPKGVTADWDRALQIRAHTYHPRLAAPVTTEDGDIILDGFIWSGGPE